MSKPMPLRAAQGSALSGRFVVPGDKSISHRALILGALAIGRSEITGLLEGEDVMATAAALRAFGARINRLGPGHYEVFGVGVGGLQQPGEAIECGNSGTSVRLLLGLAASHPVTVTFTGDQSLRSRPMERVLAPLRQMGAEVEAAHGDRLPVTITGAEVAIPIRYELPVASAQVKTAILLAGLNCAGETRVIEAIPSRDHSERMLQLFGAELAIEEMRAGGRVIRLKGEAELRPQALSVPGDPSSAAFAVVAALIVPGSDIVIENVMLNPLRSGLLDTLIEMGGAIRLENKRQQSGEQVGDIHVRASALKGVRVPAGRVPSMIDEYPILAVAAGFAEGETMMEGLAELRVKESDRLAAISDGLSVNGVSCESGADWLKVRGGTVAGGALVKTHMDHRIAMSFLVMGLAAENPVQVDDGRMIATSFPEFRSLMTGLGATLDAG